MIFNNEKTRLKEGDMVTFNEKKKLISFFRNNEPLLFSNGSAETIFPWDDLAFLYFIKILLETHGFLEKSEVSDIVNLNTDCYPIGDDSISYRF